MKILYQILNFFIGIIMAVLNPILRKMIAIWLGKREGAAINAIVAKLVAKGKDNHYIARRLFRLGYVQQVYSLARSSEGMEKAVLVIDKIGMPHFLDTDNLKLTAVYPLTGELFEIPENGIADANAKYIQVQFNHSTCWVCLYSSDDITQEPLAAYQYMVDMAQPYAYFKNCFSSFSRKKVAKRVNRALSEYYKRSEVKLPDFTIEEIAEETVYNIDDYNIRDLHDQEITGKGVAVLVLDTGFGASKQYFEGALSELSSKVNVELSCNFTSANRKHFYDGHGHGTHVAGTIASDKYGVAPGVTLIIGKVLGDNGSGSFTWIVEAMRYAIALKEKRGFDKVVVSMSLGANYPHPALEKACQDLRDAGVYLSCAAGNDGDTYQDDDVDYPGKYAEQNDGYSVAAIDKNRKRAGFSSDGTVTQAHPGVKVKSYNKYGDEWIISGTSMATPHCSGVLALMLSVMKKAPTPKALKALSIAGLDAQKGEERYYGHGICNPHKMVENAIKSA